MSVGRGNEGSVGKHFNTGVGAIIAFVVFLQAYPILPLAAMNEVVIGADPRDPIALRGRDVRFG